MCRMIPCFSHITPAARMMIERVYARFLENERLLKEWKEMVINVKEVLQHFAF